MILTLRDGSPIVTRSGDPVAPTYEPAAAALNLISHGDSNARDRGDANYIFELAALILANDGDRAIVTQRGINGISWEWAWNGDVYDGTLIDHAPVAIDPALRTDIPNKLILLGGINGMALGGHSAATEYANFETYITDRIAAGHDPDDINVCTLTPRDGFPYATIAAYNALVVAGAATHGYRVARLDLDPDFGVEGADANPAWYYDGKHYTNATHTKIAGILYDLIFPA